MPFIQLMLQSSSSGYAWKSVRQVYDNLERAGPHSTSGALVGTWVFALSVTKAASSKIPYYRTPKHDLQYDYILI